MLAKIPSKTCVTFTASIQQLLPENFQFCVAYRGVADLQPERGLSDDVNIASDATEIAGESLNTILMKQTMKR